MSRMIAASQSLLWQTTAEHIKGTVRWLAVEYLKLGKLQNIHTKETDVWAFGMTIYVRHRRMNCSNNPYQTRFRNS